MKIRGWWGIVAALGLLVAGGPGYRPARGQLGINPPNISGADAYWNSNKGGLQATRLPPQGSWGEVISANSRWMVVQNPAGQQFPIASDRIRQFLVRWPSSVDQLTPASAIEVTGPNAGSNVIIADHVDIYEADAQNLVTPTVQDLFGFNRTLTAFDVDQQNTFGTVYWMTPEEYSIPARLHVVGQPRSVNPLQVSGNGNSVYTIQPSQNGLSLSQVTLGTMTYARRGDLVYIIPEDATPRSLDVTQLVLYKKVPLRQFQP